MWIIATMDIYPEMLDEFRAFEHHAARIMQTYGGKIAQSIVTPSDEEGLLCEIHVVYFPTPLAFEGYRQDNALNSLRTQYRHAIAKQTIRIGEAGPNYHSSVS